jgi:hypothetical protein
MSNGMTNVQRLVAAGVLDDKYLGDTGRAKINAIKLTDEEIKILKNFKEELGLDPLQLRDPAGAFANMGQL